MWPSESRPRQRAGMREKGVGRKRCLAVGVLGLVVAVVAVVVLAASAHENTAAIALPDQAPGQSDTVKKALVD